MDVLLAASLLLVVVGVALLIAGRRQAVIGSRNGLASRVRPFTSLGAAAAGIGALLLLAFVAMAMATAPDVAA